ncbi:MAG: carboxypeptidase-like regulatory domain-containing protein, partial [Porphyromonas sp.]|nr:carboxypeptidase-like regulatory domain-containing protein [Porphyromonas sp.]
LKQNMREERGFPRLVLNFSVVKLLFLFILYMTSPIIFGRAFVCAQEASSLSVLVIDGESLEPLPGAIVRLSGAEATKIKRTNMNGMAWLKDIPSGKYQLKVSFVGYEEYHRSIDILKSDSLKIFLIPHNKTLREFVVTASESRGLTSASKIGQDAMRHLQPSSFSDLLELLPGGFSKDPNLTTPNAIRLREPVIPAVSRMPGMPYASTDKYPTLSLGVTFLVDGIPLVNDASMQVVDGAWDPTVTSREFVNKGVDMRSVSVDDIEEVEIVRGIPSVEYSNLTSGLIKIKRKRSYNTFNIRFKADMKSHLFNLSKGFQNLWKGFDLSLGVDYIHSKRDPRNIRETYKRMGFSTKGTQKWNTSWAKVTWDLNLDYIGSFDNDKVDPDVNNNNLDDYKSSYQKLMGSQSLLFKFNDPSWISELSLDGSYSASIERVVIDRFVELSRGLIYTDTKEQGAHDARYYPYKFDAHHEVDGRPHHAFLKLKGVSNLRLFATKHNLIYGVTWDYLHNKGKGAIFDSHKPVYPHANARARAFHEIPARQNLSIYLEDRASVSIAQNTLTVMGGLSANKLLGIDDRYKLSEHWYIDPRLNVRLAFSDIPIKGKPMKLALNGGVGWHSRFPTILQLFPELDYVDLVQLNYDPSNETRRRANIFTYIISTENFDLAPARNFKWEVRGDMDWNGYSFSATYFNERMRNGFRPDVQLHFLSFKRYDTSGLDHETLTGPPTLEDLPFTERIIFYGAPKTSNGSESYKYGIEWIGSTPRYVNLNTRLTFTGAWIKSIHRNSLPQYYRPNVILGGEELQYIGIYDDTEGTETESLTTDLRLDGYFPRIGFEVSLSFQTNWYASSMRLPISERPDKYIGLDGVYHPYTDESAKDARLQWLIRNVTDSLFDRYTVPMLTNVNLKATKFLFDEKLQLALFVNRIFDYSPDFESRGIKIRRHQVPYFGMEINMKF